MGIYDFSCNTGMDLLGYDAAADYVRIYCYWKNNGWRYHMSPVYGWVTCNGEERLVYNAGYPDFQSDNQGQYLLGYSDYTIRRQHSNITWEYHARLRSDSSYASGERTSGSGYYTTGAVTHTVITYNANGGSGAPGNQDKWYGEALNLSGTRPTRTGYSFKCWNTAANGSGTNYDPGSNYGPDPGGTVTLYAQWTANTYAVKYDANGGTGAPAQQTKTYGVDLTLSSTVPTKLDYNFLGWATTATGAVAYQPGAKYTGNSALTLYAKWELAYVKPRVTELNIQRCDSSGSVIEDGTYLRTDFSWSTDLTATYAKLQYKESSATSWTTVSIFDNDNNKSGTVSKRVLGSDSINAEKSYTARIYIYDSKGATDDNYKTYSQEFAIGTVKYPMDIHSGGDGVAFGKVAEESGVADFDFKGRFRKGIEIPKEFQEVPIGSIQAYGGTTDPIGWFICDGRILKRADYPELFNAIGTAFNYGTVASDSFRIPDFRRRFPVGYISDDDDFKPIGKYNGEKTQALRALIGSTNSDTARIGFVAAPRVGSSRYTYSIRGGEVISQTDAINHSTVVLQADDKDPTTLQPYLVTNYIIKYTSAIGVLNSSTSKVIDSLNNTSITDALSANQGNKILQMLQGVSLFKGEKCYGSTITLSRSCADFKRIQIRGYCDYGTRMEYVKDVYDIDGKYTVILGTRQGAAVIYMTNQVVNFNGTSVTFGNTSSGKLSGSGMQEYSTNTYGYVKITEIVGYEW